MSQATPGQPKLGDLLGRLLQARATAHTQGHLVDFEAGVQPLEGGPLQRVDANRAWDEAQAAVRYFGKTSESSSEKMALEAPPQWSALVASQEPVVALAFCA